MFTALCVAGAVHDIRGRRIPNALNLCVLIGGVAMIAVNWDGVSPLSHLGHFGLALAGALVPYALRFWGGGDAKFYAAAALWLALESALAFLLITAGSGILVLVGTGLAVRANGNSNWHRELPYGVAIAAGAVSSAALTL